MKSANLAPLSPRPTDGSAPSTLVPPPPGNRSFGARIRSICRVLHRDLSFFLAGMVLIYAVSGLVMNHRQTFDPHFSVERQSYTVNGPLPSAEAFTQEAALRLLEPWGETDHYTQHYFPEVNRLKIFLQGGSSLQVDLSTRQAVYEKLTPRPLLGALTRLHYNPGRWWTVFADVFAIGLLVITVTGLLMNRGPKGLWGRGGIELLLGLLIPLLFLFT